MDGENFAFSLSFLESGSTATLYGANAGCKCNTTLESSSVEFSFPFGWGELWGIADRTNFDLKQQNYVFHNLGNLCYYHP